MPRNAPIENREQPRLKVRLELVNDFSIGKNLALEHHSNFIERCTGHSFLLKTTVKISK